MTCKLCKERGKNWEGSDAKCAFPNGGEFEPNNWNCATANAIRDVCGEYGGERNPGVIWRAHNAEMDSGDQKYACIDITDAVDIQWIEDNWPLCLWVTWSKHRGRTEQMWMLCETGTPRRPTEADCLEIIAKVPAASLPEPPK